MDLLPEPLRPRLEDVDRNDERGVGVAGAVLDTPPRSEAAEAVELEVLFFFTVRAVEVDPGARSEAEDLLCRLLCRSLSSSDAGLAAAPAGAIPVRLLDGTGRRGVEVVAVIGDDDGRPFFSSSKSIASPS